MKKTLKNIKGILKTLNGIILIAMVLSLPVAAFAEGEQSSGSSTTASDSSSTTGNAESSSSSSAKSVKAVIVTNSNNDCHTKGNTLDAYVKSTTGNDQSFIAVELSEPISSVNQEITSGNLTVSEVVWKFSCEIWVEEISYDDGTTEEIYYNSIFNSEETKQKSVNLYRPYSSGCPDDGRSCQLIQIIAGTSGAGLLKTYITIMYRWAASIVGIIAVLVMVVSGIQISVDQGGGDNVTAAKTRIFQSLSALVILFLSSLILYTINPTFFTK